MRPVLRFAAALTAVCAPAFAVTLAPVAARADDATLLLSAALNPSASGAPAESCPVLLQLRNLERQPVSIIGRIEGNIGGSDFPSYRTFSFGNVAPGKTASAAINFDGDCSHPPAPGQPAGELTVRGLLMCHKGLTDYFNCQHELGTEPSTAATPIPMKIDITDWDPGGVGGGLPKNATVLPFTGPPPTR